MCDCFGCSERVVAPVLVLSMHFGIVATVLYTQPSLYENPERFLSWFPCCALCVYCYLNANQRDPGYVALVGESEYTVEQDLEMHAFGGTDDDGMQMPICVPTVDDGLKTAGLQDTPQPTKVGVDAGDFAGTGPMLPAGHNHASNKTNGHLTSCSPHHGPNAHTGAYEQGELGLGLPLGNAGGLDAESNISTAVSTGAGACPASSSAMVPMSPKEVDYGPRERGALSDSNGEDWPSTQHLAADTSASAQSASAAAGKSGANNGRQGDQRRPYAQNFAETDDDREIYAPKVRNPATGEMLALRWCNYCEIYQPIRSKHCRDCGRCVRTHDHHCPWIGTCVGERNRKYSGACRTLMFAC